MSGLIIPPLPDEHDRELHYQRRNTTEFINGDPVPLVMFRGTRVRLPSGGYRNTDPEPIGETPQTFRLIPASDRMPEIRDSNGRLVAPVYILLGEWDADMERWDRFQLNDAWFEIASPIRPEHSERRYQKKGDVVRREDV